MRFGRRDIRSTRVAPLSTRAGSSGAPSFAELARVFKGINLAGRKVAFFGSSGAAVAWLRGICADTEVSVAHSDFIGRPEPAALAAWLRGVLASA